MAQAVQALRSVKPTLLYCYPAIYPNSLNCGNMTEWQYFIWYGDNETWGNVRANLICDTAYTMCSKMVPREMWFVIQYETVSSDGAVAYMRQYQARQNHVHLSKSILHRFVPNDFAYVGGDGWTEIGNT